MAEIAWAAWKACGVTMKTTSSAGANRSRKRVQSGSFGGTGRPSMVNSVAAISSAAGDGSQTATTTVSSRGSMFRRWPRAIRPVPMTPTRIASAATHRV